MMDLVGIKLETLVSEPDTLTTRPPLSFESSGPEFNLTLVTSCFCGLLLDYSRVSLPCLFYCNFSQN